MVVCACVCGGGRGRGGESHYTYIWGRVVHWFIGMCIETWTSNHPCLCYTSCTASNSFNCAAWTSFAHARHSTPPDACNMYDNHPCLCYTSCTASHSFTPALPGPLAHANSHFLQFTPLAIHTSCTCQFTPLQFKPLAHANSHFLHMPIHTCAAWTSCTCQCTASPRMCRTPRSPTLPDQKPVCGRTDGMASWYLA